VIFAPFFLSTRNFFIYVDNAIYYSCRNKNAGKPRKEDEHAQSQTKEIKSAYKRCTTI
jgi:hypothetical protein